MVTSTKGMKRPTYSVVVPVYNEAGNIALLDSELRLIMEEMGKY